MPLAFIDQWLGCMDVRTSTATWQTARQVVEELRLYAFVGDIDDSFIIDGYEFEYQMRDAYLIIAALTPGIVVIDDIPYNVYFINPLLFDPITCAYICSFFGDLSNAPCTQQTFP